MRAVRRVGRAVLTQVPLIVLALYALVPLCLLLLNSFRSDDQIKQTPVGFPTVWHFDNFVNAWNTAGYTLAFRNSIIVSGCTIAIVCLLGGMAAYSLALLKLPGGAVMGLYYLFASTIPGILYLVPLFAIWYHLHLVDTLQGIILIYSAVYMPFGIFLLRSYFVGLPPELTDAAKVDGCSEFGVFSRIVLPLSWPAFGSVGLIIGVWTWNEFIFAVTFLHTDQTETVAVRFNAFVGQYVSNYAYMAAAGMIMILPAVLAFLSLQRRFIAGLTSGALKT
jgi:raffinose/stachyose/melibiose transport system permease protein